MKEAIAFSPCNITGFFRIHSNPTDPMRTGSTGTSVALNVGVTTHVRLKRTRKSKVTASFNGKFLEKSSVSEYVARKFLELSGDAFHVAITHTSQLPTGCGYGTSGSGALGLCFALNEAMSLSFNKQEAAQVAHVSEIACKTGLGTVSSVFVGGFVRRMTPGAPGIAKIQRLALPRSLRVVTATFGPIATSAILTDNLLRRRAMNCGDSANVSFNEDHSREEFMSASKEFSSCLGLASPRLLRLIQRLDESGFISSMAMIGESIFCMTPADKVHEVVKILTRETLLPTSAKVAESGAHIV